MQLVTRFSLNLLGLAMQCYWSAISVGQETQTIELNGDIILGGLFPIHRRSKQTENACGNIDPHPGFQYLTAMLFAIEEINNNPNLLPNITLGAKIYDTCRSQTIGADRAKDIIKYTLVDHSPPLAGVIGPFVSDVSIAVANLLRVFNIPQVSYGSTSADLSNKEIYSYFFRTVPPDSFQAYAMVDVLKEYNWDYIFTVNSYGNYGQKGMAELRKAAQAAEICVAHSAQLPSLPNNDDFKKVIDDFLRKRTENSKTVNTVVIFTTQADSADLLHAAKEAGATQFTWVGSNGWSNRVDVTEGREEVADGSLTVNHLEGEVQRFHTYFRNLTPSDNKFNPWFGEFWEAVVKCNMPGKGENNPLMSRSCAGEERLPVDIEMAPVRVVINAVYAMAHALHNLQQVYCLGVAGLCQNMTRNFQREKLLDFLRNASFSDSALNFSIHFNQNQEIDGIYDIKNFHIGTGGKWTYSNVGKWQGRLIAGKQVRGKLKINESAIDWGRNKSHPPSSFCSRACNDSQIRKPRSRAPKCCWDCINCEANDIIKDETCQSCPLGYSPSDNLSVCIKIPVLYPEWSSTPAVTIVIFVVLGVLSVIGTAVPYIKHRRHHHIKAAGRELSAIVFMGIMLCYITPLTFLGKPTDTICSARRFLGSVCFTTCYAPVLMKTIRIYRIFKSAQSSVNRPSLTRPGSQVFISMGLIAVQLLLTTLWYISEVPEVEEVYPSEGTVILQCVVNEYSLIVHICYNSLLMFLCTIFAFKTRNFPRNFNEAKYIGISMYLTCSVWIIFIPSYLNASSSYVRAYLTSGTLIVIATITLCGLLVPKVIILFSANWLNPSVSEYSTTVPTCNTSNRKLNRSMCTGAQLPRSKSFEMRTASNNEASSQFLTVTSTATSTSNLPKMTMSVIS
ncbi:metabotropic glutamate receptor 2-like [Stylophora pistillata]|uniref:metabotropic glutamate receptor 2-like n=1 Tax=Stylophora pistillata TaxID=50429 RepID=UPI000C04BE34|nr:metabotropic glutamate receptor 2-like [Stylophora pistillata]